MNAETRVNVALHKSILFTLPFGATLNRHMLWEKSLFLCMTGVVCVLDVNMIEKVCRFVWSWSCQSMFYWKAAAMNRVYLFLEGNPSTSKSYLGSESCNADNLAMRRSSGICASVCCVCFPNAICSSGELGGKGKELMDHALNGTEQALVSLHSQKSRFASQGWFEACTSKILILFYEMYHCRRQGYEVVVFISLALQQALNHWFNKQDPPAEGLHIKWRRRKRNWEQSEASGRREEHVERRMRYERLLIKLVEAVWMKQLGTQVAVGFLPAPQLSASRLILLSPVLSSGPSWGESNLWELSWD